MKEINLNSKIVLLEALEHIDRDLIAETVEDLKAPNMRVAPEPQKIAIRKSIRYTVLLAACLVLIGAIIPIVNFVMTHFDILPGWDPGENTTEESTGANTELTATEESTENATAEETTESTTAEETTEAPSLPDNMKYGEGYSIVSHNTFKIIVTENGEKLLHDARVAILSHIDGYNAIYVDVLDAEGNVKLHQMWRGKGHLFLVGDHGLLIYRVHVDAEKDFLMNLLYYQITDVRFTQSGETPLGSTKFLESDIYASIDSLSASFAYNAGILGASRNINKLLYEIPERIKYLQRLDNTVYMIADSYSDADKFATYSPEEKVLPEAIDNIQYDKYELAHILDLFGIEYNN